MQEFVIANGNERELILRAKELGWDSIVLLFSYKKGIVLPKFSEENVKVGIFLDKKVNGDFSGYGVVVALGTSFDVLSKGVTHVVMNEFEVEKDFIHQRRSGLNHVFLKDFKGEVLFAYAPVQSFGREWGAGRQGAAGQNADYLVSRQSQVIGRMMQNIKLCRKFKVEYSMCSFGSDVSCLRDVGDVKAFSRELEKKYL